MLSIALDSFPQPMQAGLLDAVDSCSTDAVRAMLDRDPARPGVALMAGLALDPVGRPALDSLLDRYAATTAEIPPTAAEVVIGAGPHAAVYAAVRVAQGFARPLVLDPAGMGGTFALGAGRATFFLNSRNRPGPLGEPGTSAALNLLPAAPMQPADIGSTEYQTDADMALVTRCALALSATVRAAQVERVERPANVDGSVVRLADGRSVRAGRVVIATGIGPERRLSNVDPDGSTVYSFAQWIARLGRETFPLADLGRVALVGNGDGARVVAESLLGIGPAAGMSTTALDYVERLDWYGPGESTGRREWCDRNRTRYNRLGASFPSNGSENARIRPRGFADLLTVGYRTAQVDGRTYDTVIVATGYRRTEATAALDLPALDLIDADGRYLGAGTGDRRVVAIGPAAGIPFERYESSTVAENVAGLYRLAPRTAALASSLPQVNP